ncbi:MAG: DNA-3-methyladenine glycosylase 2 family protein [Verrucomicrobia bacterium]|nr:DNA-3-methyladenine glycosylase 2 family protein [Verrucomicrobiota bacterium]
MTPEALTRLASADPVMKTLIETHGPCPLKPQSRQPYEALLRAIAHQQLHGAAAATILKRFRALFPAKRFPSPAQVETVDDLALRTAGFSGSKIAAIRDLTAKARDRRVPTRSVLARMEDEAIVDCLTEVRGIGRWTVEMLLIFTLGRYDVLPVGDYGVRNGFRLAYRKRMMPTPKQLLAFGEKWRPYRTTASWYLWRAADESKASKPAP